MTHTIPNGTNPWWEADLGRMANVEEIMTVVALSGVYIGPAALGLSLGDIPKPDQTEPHCQDPGRIGRTQNQDHSGERNQREEG